jgi:arsenate reductase (thioredoxin)
VDSVRRPVRRLLGVREKPLVRITEKPTPPKRKIRVLFVDVGNASRSQVAQAFATLYGFHAESAGTFPSLHVAPEAVATMRDIGVDISGFRPKPLDTSRLEAFDRIITFGQALPQQAGRNIQDWNVIDPRGLGIAGHERMREDIERRVKALARQLRVKQPALVALNP